MSGSTPHSAMANGAAAAAVAAQHLVGDEQHVVAGRRSRGCGRNSRARRRHAGAEVPITGSAMNIATVSGPSFRMARSSSSAQARLHGRRAGAIRTAVGIGRRDVRDRQQQRRVEAPPVGPPRQRQRRQRDAVVASASGRWPCTSAACPVSTKYCRASFHAELVGLRSARREVHRRHVRAATDRGCALASFSCQGCVKVEP